ncbi:SOS response-associated peptidase [Dongia sp.]|uniref:SOS response-associated peptidase n=1 Tax=Dongia sp. TaxID=1977262 RepID=UPI0035B3FAE7
MCGRYSFTQPVEAVRQHFGFDNQPNLAPRSAFAPTMDVPVVRRRADGTRALGNVRWGLVPSWAKDPKIGAKMFNARSESLAEKPSFRAAFGRRRCLILADGFYEWQKLGPQEKQVWRIERPDNEAFAFAGLWERWQDTAGAKIDSCTIITIAANALLSPIHDRMPVVIQEPDYGAWLDNTTPMPAVQGLVRQPAEDFFITFKIGPDLDRTRRVA